MATDDIAELASIARELYGVVPAEFVGARNTRVAQLRQAGERGLATRVKALPKPTAPAWAVGAVSRHAPDELDALGELGAELRVAQRLANPAELRALSKRRRELTAAVGRAALRLAEDRDVVLSPAALEQVGSTWQAVVIDPLAERVVRSCLLVRTLEPGQSDPRSALAIPSAVEAAPTEKQPEEEPAESGAPARTAAEGEPPRSLRAAPGADDDAGDAPSSSTRGDVAREVRRLRRDLRFRERAAQHAREELDDAAEELSRVEAEILQVAARLEELRREVAAAEEELEGLDDERVAAAEEREDAEGRTRAADAEVAELQGRLAALE